jgi:hypothetical protein
MDFVDQPKILADPAAREARRAQLSAPHVAPLREFAALLRVKAGSGVPDFDPWDGGTGARVLFLLAAPGRRAIDSGFVSRNNPDETAKNFFQLNREAGIDRRLTVTWNIVPWYLGDGAKIRAARRTDLEAGLPSLAMLWALLPKLSTIVLPGRKAQRAGKLIETHRPDFKVFRSPHPSPMFVNRAPGNRGQILEVLQAVAAYLIVDQPAA